MITLEQLNVQPSECSCSHCVSLCERRPCWPVPAEAEKMIDAGLASKLMLDYWDTLEGPLYILGPAIVGSETQLAPMFPVGRCTLLEGGLCSIHSTGYKPTEGRLAGHGAPRELHEAVANSWNNVEACRLILRWMDEVQFDGYERDEILATIEVANVIDKDGEN